MEKFYSNTLKCMVQQISKPKAKKLFENGEKIYFVSSKMRFDNPWTYPLEIEKKADSSIHGDFENICNHFVYYNCDNFRGKYIRFFVKC